MHWAQYQAHVLELIDTLIPHMAYLTELTEIWTKLSFQCVVPEKLPQKKKNGYRHGYSYWAFKNHIKCFLGKINRLCLTSLSAT